jgi:hypothetical protein
MGKRERLGMWVEEVLGRGFAHERVERRGAFWERIGERIGRAVE